MVLKKVLVVEDEREKWEDSFKSLLQEKAEIVWAVTLKEAEKLFLEHKGELGAIMVDGCVPGDDLNTPPLVRMFRQEGFKGVIFAISRSSYCNDRLMEAGCDDSHPKTCLRQLGGGFSRLLGL